MIFVFFLALGSTDPENENKILALNAEGRKLEKTLLKAKTSQEYYGIIKNYNKGKCFTAIALRNDKVSSNNITFHIETKHLTTLQEALDYKKCKIYDEKNKIDVFYQTKFPEIKPNLVADYVFKAVGRKQLTFEEKKLFGERIKDFHKKYPNASIELVPEALEIRYKHINISGEIIEPKNINFTKIIEFAKTNVEGVGFLRQILLCKECKDDEFLCLKKKDLPISNCTLNPFGVDLQNYTIFSGSVSLFKFDFGFFKDSQERTFKVNKEPSELFCKIIERKMASSVRIFKTNVPYKKDCNFTDLEFESVSLSSITQTFISQVNQLDLSFENTRKKLIDRMLDHEDFLYFEGNNQQYSQKSLHQNPTVFLCEKLELKSITPKMLYFDPIDLPKDLFMEMLKRIGYKAVDVYFKGTFLSWIKPYYYFALFMDNVKQRLEIKDNEFLWGKIDVGIVNFVEQLIDQKLTKKEKFHRIWCDYIEQHTCNWY